MTLPYSYIENENNVLASLSQNIGPNIDTDVQKFADISLSETKKNAIEDQIELNERIAYIKNVK